MSNQNDDKAASTTVELNQTEKALVWARRSGQALLVDQNYAQTTSPSGTVVAGGGTFAPIAEITAVASGNVEIEANASFAPPESGTVGPILQVSVNGGSFAPYYEWTDNLGSPSTSFILATNALVGQTIRARFASGSDDSSVTLGNGVAAAYSAVLILREIQPAS